MGRSWGPSALGRRFTGSAEWMLALHGDRAVLIVGGRRYPMPIGTEAPVSIHHGMFWTDLTFFPANSDTVKVDGIPNKEGKEIADSITSIVAKNVLQAARRTEELRKETRLKAFQAAIAAMEQWLLLLSKTVKHANELRLWITHEQASSLIQSKPVLSIRDGELKELLADAYIQTSLGAELESAQRRVLAWTTDLPVAIAQLNEANVKKELGQNKAFFNIVESKPLTEEQARAVICFDNRVQVVASAGSGKTSVMVAKAAYALRRKLFGPEQIILLAFNDSAAKELQERARRSFALVGFEDVDVKAMTFHSLGSAIIGEATGKKRRVPDWVVDTKASIKKLAEIVDVLKDQSSEFRTRWDLFRLVYGRGAAQIGEAAPAEEWDGVKKHGGVRTLKGEIVKSFEELAIANWLFYNGVEYKYEQDYELDTATPDRTQYRPDFYYPEIKLYHEHFALNARGQPPDKFENYMSEVVWKRELHMRSGTNLIETTSYQLWTGQLFNHLTKELTSRGVLLDPNPDRPLPSDGQQPIKNEELFKLMRTFIGHAKSNGYSTASLKDRLEASADGTFKHRYRLFLELVGSVREAWDAALTAERGIDFEDMLNQAAEHIEQGRWKSPYKLVLADEFQDASWARFRLAKALVNERGRHLFAVGDDWQSIYRFAGADVSVMTKFKEQCGHGQILRLERTFRCPQALCDISSGFVSKNPAQLKKAVRSETQATGAPLLAFQVARDDQIQGAVDRYLAKLHAGLAGGTIPAGRNGKVSVFVLGRYRKDRDLIPENWRAQFGNLIDLTFHSMHTSKGGEADYVILPQMVQDPRLGFPNRREDDPVLAMAMPSSDTFPCAEERRLFYVALTRARRTVAMFTVRGKISQFLDELVDDGAVAITDLEGNAINEPRCPECKMGALIKKAGQHGPFVGCSNFPNCRFTVKQAKKKSRRPSR